MAEPDFYRQVAALAGTCGLHIPAVVDYLTGSFRYYVEHAEWLTVAREPD